MSASRPQPSALWFVTMAACLAATAASWWAQSGLGVSALPLAVVAMVLERSTASRAFRTIWYGTAILLCVTMTVVLVRRALAGGAV